MPRRHQWLNKSRMAWGSFGRYRLSEMLPRMSWDRRNLFNIWQRSQVYIPERFRDDKSKITVQRLIARKLVSAYHCEPFTFRQMKKRVMANLIPFYRVKAFDNALKRKDAITSLPPNQRSGPLPDVPISTLIFSEIERRLDYLVFRACFAPSLWEARVLIHQGKIKVEGTICRMPQLQLEPGMMFSTEPRHLKWGLHLPPHRNENVSTLPPPSSEPEASTSAKTLDEPTEGEAATDKDASTEGKSEEAKEAIEARRAERKEQKKAEKAMARTERENWSIETRRKGEMEFKLPDYAAPSIFIPAYLEVNFAACAAVYVRHPTAKVGLSEIPSPWDAQQADLFRLNQEFWMLHRMKPRRKIEAGQIRFKPGKVFQRDNNRVRYIGHGGAAFIGHLDKLRQASERDANRSLASLPEGEREGAREEMRERREARRRMYSGSRLRAEAIPTDVAAQFPSNRVKPERLQRSREERTKKGKRRENDTPNLFASKFGRVEQRKSEPV